MEIATFYGPRGEKYEYGAYSLSTLGVWGIPLVPANYMFAKRVPDLMMPSVRSNTVHYWEPIYIGQSGNLRDRLTNYGKDRVERIAKHQPTHFLFHESSAIKDIRVTEEEYLIRKYNPPCNIQHIHHPPGTLISPPPPPGVPPSRF